MNNDRKNIVIRTDSELHKQVKIHATELGTTVQDYVLQLIVKDLEKNKQRR